MITRILDNPLHENNTACFEVKRALCHSELQTMEVECIVLNSNNSATRALSIEFQSGHMIHYEFSHDVFVFTCTTWTLYKTQSRVAIKPEQSQPIASEFILVLYWFCGCCKTCTRER